MGKHHKHHKKSIWHSISNNHTLKFLADPVRPIEKISSTAHKDIKGAVKYGGKHLIGDVDTLSNSAATYLPIIIGGIVVVMVMNNKK